MVKPRGNSVRDDLKANDLSGGWHPQSCCANFASSTGSVLVCGYMWMQMGYFEIKNLGVDNNLKTKLEHRLRLGEGRGKKIY